MTGGLQSAKGSQPMGYVLQSTKGSQPMGSLPNDWRCGWCGRRGAGSYFPWGNPPVALCGKGGPGGKGCLFGARKRVDVMRDALRAIFQLSSRTTVSPFALQQLEVLTILARML